MFFPIGDDNTARKRVPFVTMTLIVINALAFLAELSAHGQGRLEAFVTDWSVIPATYTGLSERGGPVPWTLITAMFLHGGWAHLLGNMVYLGIFGDNVESALGHVKFLIFYFACGIAASLAHIFTAPASMLPSLGASGAISGVLAGYLLMFPANAVLVVIFLSVRAVPAFIVIGFWALLQFVNSAGAFVRTPETESGGVAYMAHIGGFVMGLLLTFLLRPRGQRVPAR